MTAAAHLIDLPTVMDLRGTLTMIQEGDGLPFAARRVLILTQPKATQRGGHAHRTAAQLFVMTRGAASFTTIAGATKRFHLMPGGPALSVPPRTWLEISAEEGSQMLLLSDELYDEAEYIRDWAEFQSLLDLGAQS